jgi:hypothetical protein
MIQGCAKFDNNVKAEDEKAGKGLGCEPSGVLVFGSAGIRLGVRRIGGTMPFVCATVGDGFLEAWAVDLSRYEPPTLPQ